MFKNTWSTKIKYLEHQSINTIIIERTLERASIPSIWKQFITIEAITRSLTHSQGEAYFYGPADDLTHSHETFVHALHIFMFCKHAFHKQFACREYFSMENANNSVCSFVP
jgi:hypothetical protein